MTVRRLDRSVVKEELPAGKTGELFWDDTLKGFGLRLHLDASGVVQRSWIIQYRVGTAQHKQKIGDCAKLTCDQARKRATELLAKVTLGQDPQAEKQAARAATAITLRSVIDQYLQMKDHEVQAGSYRPASMKLTKMYLTGEQYFGPLHATGINAVTRATVATRFNSITVNSGSTTASRCRAALRAFYSWAMAQGIAEANPTIGTLNPENGSARDRVLSEDELVSVWRACGDDDFGRIVRLLILTGCRRQEIGSLRWSEIDLDKGTLTIPAARSKNHRELVLPLSDAMRDIITSVPPRVGRDDLFGERKHGFGSWQYGMRNFKHGVKKPWKLHDIRRSVATHMAEIGIEPHIIEAVLNHASGHKSGVAGIYNRASYAKQMKSALIRWANHIAHLIDGGEQQDEQKAIPMRAS